MARCILNLSPKIHPGDQLQTYKLSRRRSCSQQKLSSRRGQQTSHTTMFLKASWVDLGYHTETLNYRYETRVIIVSPVI